MMHTITKLMWNTAKMVKLTQLTVKVEEVINYSLSNRAFL
jgi:hypothetical protein